jgi:hypothetical protein
VERVDHPEVAERVEIGDRVLEAAAGDQLDAARGIARGGGLTRSRGAIGEGRGTIPTASAAARFHGAGVHGTIARA